MTSNYCTCPLISTFVAKMLYFFTVSTVCVESANIIKIIARAVLSGVVKGHVMLHVLIHLNIHLLTIFV